MVSDTSSESLKRSSEEMPLHKVFFTLFLFSLPFSIRKIIATLSPDGVFNEYTDISVYLSDILLVATFLIYILENKSSILSIEYWRKMFHVEHLFLPISIPFFFIVWSGLSISWSESLLLALVTWMRLIEGYILYLYILTSHVPRGTCDEKSEKCSTWNIWRIIFVTTIISGSFQSIIAIFQFIRKESIGITFLKESAFSIYDPGIAKILIDGDIFVRSYGFFPHPNVLGGFLAVSLLMTTAYPLIFNRRMFHVEHSEQNQANVPRGTLFSTLLKIIVSKCSTWNISHTMKRVFGKMFHVEHLKKWLYRGIIFIQLSALFCSFSKTAIFSYGIGFIMLISVLRAMFHVEHVKNKNNVPRGTLKNKLFYFITEQKLSAGRRLYRGGIIHTILQCSTWNNIMGMLRKMFHVEQLIIIGGAVFFGFVLYSFNLKLFLVQPFIERLFYLKEFSGFSEAYFFHGLGMGQFVFTMQQFFSEKLLPWQFQPIHNVPLLVLSEVGIVGFGLFLWFYIYIYMQNEKNVPRGTYDVQGKECSTWNIDTLDRKRMFHVEHFTASVVSVYLIRSLLVGIMIMMFFDHYFWDIQQGQLLLWIIFALAASRR